MQNLIYDLQYDIYDNIFFYGLGCFILTIILIFICEFIESNLIENIIRKVILIFTILIFVLFGFFFVTKVIVNSDNINEIKDTYNIKQQGDELKLNKKDNIHDIIYKKEATFKITKEKVTTNYDYDNEHVSESKEEHYILTDTNNNEKFKLTKDELKQLISYTKTENEKFNVDDLKS